MANDKVDMELIDEVLGQADVPTPLVRPEGSITAQELADEKGFHYKTALDKLNKTVKMGLMKKIKIGTRNFFIPIPKAERT